MTFNYIGPINSTGYGIASASYLKALLKLDKSIGFKPIGDIAPPIDLNQEAVEHSLRSFNPKLPTFCFWHLFDINKQLEGCTDLKVAMSTFELPFFTLGEIDSTKWNSLCTASEWGEKVLSLHFNKHTAAIPHAFKEDDDTILPLYSFPKDLVETWNKVLHPIKIQDDSLILSTAGKYESRKGHPELIDACIEVGESIPIVLIAYVHNPFIPDNYPYSFINSRSMYPAYTSSGIKVYTKNKFKLILMPRELKRTQLHNVLSKAHYFISPSKGEGWNLPLFEMMSYGMPCITTLNTAHTDYCHSANVVPISKQQDEDMYAAAYDGIFFNGSTVWHNVSRRAIKSAIMDAVSYKEDTSYLSSLSKHAVASTSKFTWQKSAQKIINMMTKL